MAKKKTKQYEHKTNTDRNIRYRMQASRSEWTQPTKTAERSPCVSVSQICEGFGTCIHGLTSDANSEVSNHTDTETWSNQDSDATMHSNPHTPARSEVMVGNKGM